VDCAVHQWHGDQDYLKTLNSVVSLSYWMISDGNQDCELTGCSHDEIAILEVLVLCLLMARTVIIMAIIVTTIEEAAIVSKIKMAIKLIAIIRLLMI